MSRPAPIVEFHGRGIRSPMESLIPTLRAILGRLTSLVELALLSVPAGYAVAAGATTSLPGTKRLLNTADANLNQARLLVEGMTAAGTVTAQLYDLTASAVLASVTLTNVNQLHDSGWVVVGLFNSDHQIEARIVGDSVNAQTIYGVSAHFRTTSVTP